PARGRAPLRAPRTPPRLARSAVPLPRRYCRSRHWSRGRGAAVASRVSAPQPPFLAAVGAPRPPGTGDPALRRLTALAIPAIAAAALLTPSSAGAHPL